MHETAILVPVVALVGWTLVVLLFIPFRRFRAGFAGQVSSRDFKFGESANVPGHVSIPNRNFMNLLEAPVLFYVVCITFYVMHFTDSRAVTLAWIYVALRVLHSIVHLTYNSVRHRLVVYAASTAVLFTMWVRLLIEVLHG